MAWSGRAGNGTVSERASDTAIAGSPTTAYAVDDIAVIVALTDNFATSSGLSNEHSTFTDTDGHTWTKLFEETVSSGVAADGMTVSAWATKVTAAIGTSDVGTLTLANAVLSKTFHWLKANVAAGTFAFADLAVNIDQSETVTLSGLGNAEHWWVGVAARENEDVAVTEDVDYDVGQDSISSMTGASSTNVALHTGSRIFTGTSDTYAPTDSGAGERMYVLFALDESGGGTPATVEPTVIALVVALPAPAILAEAAVASATIALAITLPAASIMAASVVAPAVVALVATLPAATINIAGDSIVVEPGVIALASVHPAVLVSVPAIAAPGVIAMAVMLDPATVSAASIANPAVIALSTTLPPASALSAAVVIPAVIALSVATPAQNIAAASVITPDVIVLAIAIAQAITSVGAVVTPAVMALALTLPTATVLVYVVAYMRPDADLFPGSWDTGPTSGGALWESISKEAVDDTTYIEVSV